MNPFVSLKPSAFQVMSKPMGATCNLNCTYCYYLEKKGLYNGRKDFKMPDDVLETYTRQYIEQQEAPVVSFVWQGGEPTMAGIDFFRKAIAFQKEFANGKKIENSFQTNGTLLNDEWCNFLKENDFLVGISIDGPEELHDYYRKYSDGSPSFDKVMNGIRLLKKHGVAFNTLSVVNRKTSEHPLEVYHFLKEAGSTFIQFIPIIERAAVDPAPHELSLVSPDYQGKAVVTDWSVLPEQYGKFLISIFEEWVRNDVGKYFVQLFDVTLANWVGEAPGLCVFNETCGNAAVIEHNGDVYSCDHFVYSDYVLGNIMKNDLGKMITSEKQVKFGLDKRNKLPSYCIDCEYRFACHGECPKHRFMNTPDGEPGLNYLCEAYKMFFRHVHPYMQYMGDELTKKRPPSNVMNWVRRIDERKAGQIPGKRKTVGRNDLCPCGSGRKFKNCCINITSY